MKILKKILSVLFAVILSCLCFGCKNDKSSEDDVEQQEKPTAPAAYTPNQSDTVCNLSAVDACGREFDITDGFDEQKKVGIFYFLWCGRHSSAKFDMSEMTYDELKADGNIGVQHYWGKPLYGYYDSGDPWVIRKHMELFAYAGIDYIVLDVTNDIYREDRFDYRPTVYTLLDILLDMKENGWQVPQVAFYTNTNSGENVRIVYQSFYDETNDDLRKYDELWFDFEDTDYRNEENKPWIMAVKSDFDKLPVAIRGRFYLRHSQWPNAPDDPNGFPWMSWTDRSGDYRQSNHNGIMSVSIAQHPSGAFSDAVFAGSQLNRGRGWSKQDGKNDTERVDLGTNFAEQWEYAISLGDSVNNIFITGWNEWVAQKQAKAGSRTTAYFVDCFDKQYSRDAEMMQGGYGDAYYLQICDYIRKFKGIYAPGSRTDISSVTVDLDGDENQWSTSRGYLDPSGDTVDRNYKSANYSLPDYTDNSGRNDITSVRVTYDSDNLYFLIACAREITEYDGGANWMNVLLAPSDVKGEKWENYSFVINRTVLGNVSSVERLRSSGDGVKVGEAQIRLRGKTLWMAVPRSALGKVSGGFTLKFKVADHVTKYKDIMDYYVSGDSAPMGRLNYTVEIK